MSLVCVVSPVAGVIARSLPVAGGGGLGGGLPDADGTQFVPQDSVPTAVSSAAA